MGPLGNTRGPGQVHKASVLITLNPIGEQRSELQDTAPLKELPFKKLVIKKHYVRKHYHGPGVCPTRKFSTTMVFFRFAQKASETCHTSDRSLQIVHFTI